jgi:uncharacterized phage infection (PIP) family protein YhgE
MSRAREVSKVISTVQLVEDSIDNIDLSSSINTASAAAVAYLIDGAPAALNTLNELAAALDDNADILDLYLTQSSLYFILFNSKKSLYEIIKDIKQQKQKQKQKQRKEFYVNEYGDDSGVYNDDSDEYDYNSCNSCSMKRIRHNDCNSCSRENFSSINIQKKKTVTFNPTPTTYYI